MVDDKVKNLFVPKFDQRLKDIQTELDNIVTYSENSRIIGDILINHLVLEKYINVLVLDKHPDLSIVNFERDKFSDKIKVLKKLDIFSERTITAINAINEIRNHFSHSLEINKLDKNHLNKLENYLVYWLKEDDRFKKFNDHKLVDKLVQLANYFILIEISLSLTLNETKKALEDEFAKYKDEMLDSFVSISKG